MGIPAAEPNNYLGLLKKDAVLMNVDAVYVVFFVGNDIIQSHPDFKTVVWLGSTREVLRQPYLIGLSKEYSYVYRTVRSVKRLVRERIDNTSRRSHTKANFMAIEYQRSDIYRIDSSSYIQKSYNGAVRILKEISEEGEHLKKHVFIVLAPDELQVNDELRVSLIEKYNMNAKSYEFSRPQKLILDELNNTELQIVDLLPAFREAAEQEALYIEQNTHWNRAGNRLAAEKIFSHLVQQRAVLRKDL
jgi:hypothetical protein